MNQRKPAVIFSLLAVTPLFGQTDVRETIQKAEADLARTQTLLSGKGMPMLNLDLQGMNLDLQGLNLDIQGLKSGLLFQTHGIGGRFESRTYDNGTRALDDHNYEEAVKSFDAVIDSKQPRTDGALYWKAYALNRLGKRDDALAALAALRHDYPASHWLNDAQALEAEVKQGSGQAVSPAQDSNEEIKLMAINSLMGADPERAMPLLEGLLKGNSTPRLKDRALFVLTQSRSPRAQQILTEYAKGAGNPDLQIRAIRYLGMSGIADEPQQLAVIYTSSNDTAVKREIIRALMNAKSKDALFTVAKSEKDEGLRSDSIMELGVMRATDQLSQIYTANSDPKSKKDVINAFSSYGEAKPLIDLARREPDPSLKKIIVQRLAGMHSKEATDYMLELLK